MLDTQAKQLVKKFTKDNRGSTTGSHIPFSLLYEGGGCMELMSTNFNSFHQFQVALFEIEKHKRNMKFEDMTLNNSNNNINS